MSSTRRRVFLLSVILLVTIMGKLLIYIPKVYFGGGPAWLPNMVISVYIVLFIVLVRLLTASPSVLFTLYFFFLLEPIPTSFKYASAAVLLAYLFAMRRLHRLVYRMSCQGDHDRALRIDRVLSFFPAYYSVEGALLVQAGRYSEARAFLKPLAFDRQGKPVLTSAPFGPFYLYMITLANDGSPAEGESLLEEAIKLPRQTGALSVVLASCLLTQKKNSERACKLMEEVLATCPKNMNTKYPAVATKRIALYAWALASCGRRLDAEAKMQEALMRSTGFKGHEAAGMQYFCGETWEALNERPNARQAYRQAIDLSPNTYIAIMSKKGLARVEAI